jgi:hypothetical protein
MKDHWQATCHPLNVLLEKDGCLAYQPMVVAVDKNGGGAGGRDDGKGAGICVIEDHVLRGGLPGAKDGQQYKN